MLAMSLKPSPRIVWVIQKVHSLLNKKGIILDVGYRGNSEQPDLHLDIKRQNSQLHIIGLDIDTEGVIQQHLPDTLAGDATCLPCRDHSLDAILCLEMVEHIYQPERMLLEFQRALKYQGKIIMTTPNAWAWWNVTKHWLFGSLGSRKRYDVYRSYLGAPSHKRFFDPLSLLNMLNDYGLETVELVTKNHSIPFVSRFSRRCRALDFQFWPMNRLGGYICLIAQKKTE